MSNEPKPCPFVSDDWCVTFDEPCIAVRGDSCKEYERIKSYYGNIEKRNEALEAENRRLRSALRDIEDFAHNEYWKVVPAPICVKFRMIDQYAEKVLKGIEVK